MTEKFYKVLRSSSLEQLQQMISDASAQGWEVVGNADVFDGEYAQSIKYIGYEDDTTEIITIPNIPED